MTRNLRLRTAQKLNEKADANLLHSHQVEELEDVQTLWSSILVNSRTDAD